MNMAMSEGKLIKRINESPINHTLLKLVHHEMGNGLAVLSGYRHLLQRAIAIQAQEAAPPGSDIWKRRNEQWLGYLQTMREREALLQGFLTQLRELSPGVTYDRFCQEFVQVDFAILCRRVVERLIPLHPDRTLKLHLPAQPLYVLCDPPWIEVVLEHVILHTITAHRDSSPIDIRLEVSHAPVVQEAKLTVPIKRNLPAPLPAGEEMFAAWSQVLDQREREICSSMCQEVLAEHGGRAWSEYRGEDEEIVFLTLPLVE